MDTNECHKPAFKRSELIESGHLPVSKTEEKFRIAIVNLETQP